MARYRLTETAYIDDQIREAGEEIEFDGIPGAHMELIKGDAEKIEEANRVRLLAEAQAIGCAGVNERSTLEEIQAAYGEQRRHQVIGKLDEVEFMGANPKPLSAA